MDRGRVRSRRLGIAVAVLAMIGVGVAPAASSTTPTAARGFDGTTLTVAGIGLKGQLPMTETAVQARIKRFNSTNEIKGVKIEFAEFVEDNQDAATALAEARRLVTQEGVFAIVGDTSPVNPDAYFEQQHVPYFGGGFDSSYCSTKPSTAVWGFSTGGCTVPDDPSWIADSGKAMYEYVNEKTGKEHPTVAVISNDSESGRNTTDHIVISLEGAGFDVVHRQNKITVPSPSDYTPFVQEVLEADGGDPPDVAWCLLTTDCIPMWNQLDALGFEGTFNSGLYSNLVAAPMESTLVLMPFVNPLEDSSGMRQLKADMDAYERGSGAEVDIGAIYGYTSTDMFIQALKTVAKKGKSNITPENVQKVASKMTWEIEGVMGPVHYPQATVADYAACFSVFESDGTQWNTVVPYTCSTKKISPDLDVG